MASTLHPNGSVSSVVALGIARQAAESSLSVGATTSSIPEGSNLYFTAVRARSVLSALAPIYYNPSTGQISASIGIGDVSNLQNILNGKEPVFSKNTAFNKNFGSSAGTVCEGNDSRLSNARTPVAHTHSISDVINLQTSLDSKANTIHSHTISSITNLQTELDNKANVFIGYTGSISVITDVNFTSQTVTTKTLTYTNGVLTNVS